MLFPLLIFFGVLILVGTYFYFINSWLGHEEASGEAPGRVETRQAVAVEFSHGIHTVTTH